MSQKIGLIDMDGVLYDYIGQLKRDLLSIMSPNEILPSNLFDDEYPWIKARMKLIKSIPGWWRNLPKLQLGWDIFNLSKELGFENQILSKGPKRLHTAWAEKCECICADLGEETTVNIVGKNKNNYYGHFLCEDYPEYLKGWLEYRPRGLGILINNDYNTEFNHPNVIRYDGSNIEEVRIALTAVKNRDSNTHWKNYAI